MPAIEPKDLDRAKRSKENATNAFDDLNSMINTTKQLTAYARNPSFGTCYVASFDGDHLLLCVFSEDTNADPL